MTKDKYPLYGLAIVAGGAVAIWAGLSPFLLIILLVCPLMMFFMMSGMHGGHEHGGGHNSPDESRSPAPTRNGRKE